MPLVFSPLSEEVIELPPRILYPRYGFIMRQIGDAPQLDKDITEVVVKLLKDRKFGVKDADASTGGKDFLERILGLIRGTGHYHRDLLSPYASQRPREYHAGTRIRGHVWKAADDCEVKGRGGPVGSEKN